MTEINSRAASPTVATLRWVAQSAVIIDLFIAYGPNHDGHS